MKTMKISDETHGKLTVIKGQLTMETGEAKTYDEVIEAILKKYIEKI